MPKAIWEGIVLAEAASCVAQDGRHYFPPDSLRRQYLQPSTTYSLSPRKGSASYFHVEVNGKRMPDAAWYYPEPREDAFLQGHVAFALDVKIEP